MKIKWLLIVLCFCYTGSSAQPDTVVKHLGKWTVPAIHISAAAGSLYIFSQSWYSDYPPRSFHFTNDLHHWRMMDKGGHAWAAYTIARLSTPLWQQTGMNKRQAIYHAGIIALSYQAIIEGLDGFSSKWGFSWGDMGANSLGTIAYVAQELAFNKQVVQLKFMSFKPLQYPSDILDRADRLFGHTFTSRLLNDYNAQTYWASINIKAVLPRTKLPGWFNIAVGYGARQMLGETTNSWTNKNDIVVDRSDIPRYSRFLVSPDIDLTKINTRHTWLRVLLYIANAIKIPAPGLEYNSKGQWNCYALLLN